jgi:thiamine pyrophosphate-dependent acetolactate synthase large subunit-like protein
MSLQRREVISALLAAREDVLVVTGLGSTAWDVTAAGDHPLNFPLWGAMGNSVMIGLGIALARPERRVMVITGDGEMLMGLGSLATVAVQRPTNLAVIVIDNQRYGETGMQVTHTAHGVNLAQIALASAFPLARQVREPSEMTAFVRDARFAPGPCLFQVDVNAGSEALVLPPRDGGLLKARLPTRASRRCCGPSLNVQLLSLDSKKTRLNSAAPVRLPFAD